MLNAILISGELRTFWYCAQSIFDNLVKPNSADVFIIGCPYKHGRNSHPLNKNNIKFNKTGGSYDSRESELWLEFDEKNYFKNIFGDNLKCIKFISDIDNYYQELDKIFAKKCNLFNNNGNYLKDNEWYDKKNIRYDHSHPGPSYGVTEQYFLLNKTLNLLKDYEKKKNINYDIIFRIRPDFFINNIFDFNTLFSKNEDLYIRNNIDIKNKFYSSDYIFFGKRNIMDKIISNFYKEYGYSLFPFNKYKDLFPDDKKSYNLNYVAETCFGLFLSNIECKKEILQDLNCQHGYLNKEINLDYNKISKKFKITKVGVFNIGINYNKKKITYIYSTHFNMPEYIELQLKSLKKYFDSYYKFIVINDAKITGDLTNFNQKDLDDKISNVCLKNKIECVRFSQNFHNNRKILFPDTKEPKTNNAVTRCADVTQFCINDFVNKYNNGYLMILDADMFFINNFNILNFMKNHNISGITQKMGYLWNGICIFDSKLNLKELNFDCGYVNNQPVDVGGQTYYFMEKYKDIIKFKPITCSHYTFEETFVNDTKEIKKILLEYCNLRKDKSANKEIILNKCILHIRSGGNWDYRTKEFKYNELNIIKNYIDN